MRLSASISFGGYKEFYDWTYYSEGKIWTNGINGVKEWNGTFRGDFPRIHLGYLEWVDDYFVGVNGFCGIKIAIGDYTRFFGFTRKVKIEYV